MEYKRFDNVIVARFDRGEEILETLNSLMIPDKFNPLFE